MPKEAKALHRMVPGQSPAPNGAGAKARIKINKLLEESEWRFFDDKLFSIIRVE